MNFQENGLDVVSNIDNELCKLLLQALHQAKYSGKKLFCNGVIPVTPEKVTTSETSSLEQLAVGGAESAPPGTLVPPSLQLQGTVLGANINVEGDRERRKSVLELVTDFSSCISSSEEPEPEGGSWVDSSRRQKRSKRKASKSPEQVLVSKK